MLVAVSTHLLTDAELVLPTIRSAVEKQLNLIAQGKADYRQVLGHTLDVFKRKFHYFVDSIAGKVHLFPARHQRIPPSPPPIRAGSTQRTKGTHMRPITRSELQASAGEGNGASSLVIIEIKKQVN